jgi:hypothetical protein
MRTSVICLLFLLVISPAQAHQCSRADAQAAVAVAATLRSWQSIYAAYERYGPCDDGAIAEGFTDSVVHLLATNWASLSDAQSLIAQNPAFRSFVISHINASADSDEIAKIAVLASTQCPLSATSLCKEILGAANEP